MEQARLQSELESVRRLVPRVGKVAHLKAGLKELDRRISSKAGSIGGGGAMRSQVMVNRDLKEANRAALVNKIAFHVYSAYVFELRLFCAEGS